MSKPLPTSNIKNTKTDDVEEEEEEEEDDMPDLE